MLIKNVKCLVHIFQVSKHTEVVCMLPDNLNCLIAEDEEVNILKNIPIC